QAQLKQQSIAHEKTDAELFAKVKNLKAGLEGAVAQKEKAEGKVAIQNEQLETLSASIAKASREKDEANASLAHYKATGYEPEQLAALPEQRSEERRVGKEWRSPLAARRVK